MGMSTSELLIILAIAVLIFGTKRLRNVGGDLGEAIKSFRKAMKDDSQVQSMTGVDAKMPDGEVVNKDAGKDTV